MMFVQEYVNGTTAQIIRQLVQEEGCLIQQLGKAAWLQSWGLHTIPPIPRVKAMPRERWLAPHGKVLHQTMNRITRLIDERDTFVVKQVVMRRAIALWQRQQRRLLLPFPLALDFT